MNSPEWICTGTVWVSYKAVTVTSANRGIYFILQKILASYDANLNAHINDNGVFRGCLQEYRMNLLHSVRMHNELNKNQIS
jgi:hypothetical protein